MPELQNLILRPFKKAAAARSISKLPGFRTHGNYYLGTCNADVMAGYCIDAPPSSIYIWRFVIPPYDNVEFLHMALGRRILSFSYSELSGPTLSNMLDRLSDDWATFSNLTDRRSLISYIQDEAIGGHYALWTRFITCVRDRDFDKASALEAELSAMTLADTSLVGRNFNSLFQEKRNSGWEGASKLLDAWSRRTLENYCST